jgi:hypothetical protein
MDRKHDGEDSKFYFKTDRFIVQNGEWYYMTREGVERGPFESREAAERDSAMYILEQRKRESFNMK